MIRVLVVEDSAVVREHLAWLLEQDPALQVVGMARDGVEAVAEAQRLKPDVILMDVYLPRLDGYQATRQIMERVPTPIVMVSSRFSGAQAAMTFEALKAGALMVVAKPVGLDHAEEKETARRVVETVRLMAEVKVVRRWAASAFPAQTPPPPAASAPKVRLIAIGASTGGPPVVAEILRDLPADLPAPVLIVQHIAPGFVPGLAEWLDQQTRLLVKPAEPHESVRPRTVYLAPDDLQMGVTGDGRIRLTGKAGDDHFCPSASHLFESAARVYRRSALGVLLTGIGSDGAEGLGRIREAGGVTIAQDEESSVVFGMPAEALRLGAAQYVLSPRQIPAMICSLLSHEVRR